MRNHLFAKLKGLLYFSSILLLAGNYSSIYQKDLFHLIPHPPLKVEVKPIIREPLLSEILVLKGTVVGTGLSSLAVIENRPARSESIYQEGEEVAGAKIVRIESDRVNLLDKDGKEVVLALSSAGGVSGGPVRKPVIAETNQAPPVTNESLPDDKTLPSIPVSLADITQQVVQNPAELRDLKVAPVVSEGKVSGYQVKNIAAGSLVARYGIQNGDVVTRVNGVALENLSQVNEIYRSIRPGTPFAVEILRAGSPLTLNFQLTP